MGVLKILNSYDQGLLLRMLNFKQTGDEKKTLASDRLLAAISERNPHNTLATVFVERIGLKSTSSTKHLPRAQPRCSAWPQWGRPRKIVKICHFTHWQCKWKMFWGWHKQTTIYRNTVIIKNSQKNCSKLKDMYRRKYRKNLYQNAARCCDRKKTS